MSKLNRNLLELDIDKLFEDHGIDEIVEIKKLLDAEIERKRNELRSMVGDRYKDILTASDAIKSMKTISAEIVSNIEKITNTCETLVGGIAKVENKHEYEINKDKLEERTLVIQIRLAIFMNEQIWIALDEDNNFEAAQCYLLAQHIHTGLSLMKKERLDKIPLLQQIKHNLFILREKIFQRITEKLESVEITADETSCNLNALMLLKNQSSSELISIFIEHRKTALNTVINTSHSSVRVQISAMVRCLITTVHLLHDCFIYSKESKSGLIWIQLNEIVSESAPPTLSKLNLPFTPLLVYIPDIIKHYRPKCKSSVNNVAIDDTKSVLEEWLKSTEICIRNGLVKSLQLVTNVKGLHKIREEVLKIESPENWEKICADSNLPSNFDIWYFFFQALLTERAKLLISKQIATSIKELQNDISNILNSSVKSEKSELDLRWYTWNEDNFDISKTDNNHTGLAMKTKGFSEKIVSLCEKLDAKYFELLQDVSQYLYGQEFSENPVLIKDFKHKQKFIDKEELETHLRLECTKHSTGITTFIETLLKEVDKKDIHFITKSLICARFLQAIPQLCSNFTRCCTFNNTTEDWTRVCDNFNKTSLALWQNWVHDCCEKIQQQTEKELNDLSPHNMIKLLAKWDNIEIQEQTDDKVFKSHIRVPLKESLALHSIISNLTNIINSILPHTIPKSIHQRFIEDNMRLIFNQYKKLLSKDLNQNQALQFLFDIKFITTLCIPRENVQLMATSQEICDKLRSKIDPFDLDVFYSYLQNNVKRAVCQSQVIFGCLLPSPNQLASLGISEKSKELEKEPSILALSIPTTNAWFPLLPVTAPSQKVTAASIVQKERSTSSKPVKKSPKRSQDPTAAMRSGAAALFGGLTTDWFS